MNCTACPYQKQIDALRRRCMACNPDDDSGMPHGRVRADEFTLNSVPKAKDFDRTPGGQATRLAPDDEHRLRMAMSSLFALDPLDLLLVQHLMRQRTLESFAEVQRQLVRQIGRYRGPASQRAWARKSAIVRAFPQFEAVLRSADEPDAASRIERELGSRG